MVLVTIVLQNRHEIALAAFERFLKSLHSLTWNNSGAYDADQPFADLLNTAMILPIFEEENVGI